MVEVFSPNSYFLPCFVMLILSSVFPISALAYQVFQRDKRYQELIEDFDLLGITPTKKLEEIYKQPRYFALLSSVVQFILPVLLTILGTYIIFLGLTFSLANIQDSLKWLETHRVVILALGYGFLGAYLFSIQLIYRRYTTIDLQPSVYMLCTLTLISAFAFNFTAFTVINNLRPTASSPQGLEAGIFAIVAFSLGYFPTLAIRWFNQIANSAIGINRQQSAALPLSVIDGISQFHETRLRDEGIDNVQNLASVKIDDLLLKTRFNAQQVLEWIDQAILHSYVDPGTFQSFRRGGVRKISDFQDLWRPYYNQIEADDKARQSRAQQLQSTPDHLDALYTATLTGPNIAYIEYYWTNVKKAVQEQQQRNIEDLLTETKKNLDAAQTDIFQLISQSEFDDHNRVTLGEITNRLSPNPEMVALDFQENTEPEILTGLAWWLGWLTISEENDYELVEQACQYYQKAIRNKLEVRYELARFYYELVKYYIDQKEDNKSALKLADSVLEFSKQSADDRELTLILKTILALIHIKTNKQNEAIKLIKEAKEIIENFPDDDAPIEQAEILQEIWKKLQEVPEYPEAVTEVLEKIEARSNSSNGNSSDEKKTISSDKD